MMKKVKTGKTKKMLASFLAVILLASSLAGCGVSPVVKGKGEVSGNESGDGQTGQQEEKTDESGADPNAKGRYVEQEVELPLSPSRPSGFAKLEDGTLVIPDKEGPRLISKDGGETWEIDKQAWMDEVLDEYYILDIAVLPNGETLISGSEHGGDWESAKRVLFLVKEDGSRMMFHTPSSASSEYVNHIFVSDSGRAFAMYLGSDYLYELNLEEGSVEQYLKMDDSVILLASTGNILILCTNRGKVLLYDMEQESYIEDSVWDDFMKEQYAISNWGSSDNAYECYVFPGEDNTFYMAGKKGLHRHAAGGSAIEQVIDGSLSSFSSPSLALQGMIMLENEQFLTLFTDYYNSKLIRYVYDPDIPTVPGQRIKAYSLKENDVLRQAISMFQSANSDAYVDYEIGMEEGSSTTRDDALKKLNTEIMAGEGPDILILDGLPVDSYVEKGILKDLSPLLLEMTGDDALFANIAEAFEKDGKTYYLPAEVSFTVAAGHEKDAAQIGDMASLADAVEKLRKENPEKDILALYSGRMILKLCALFGGASWKKADGSVDEASLKEFFTQSKRIYDAQMDGLPQKLIDDFKDLDMNYQTDYGLRYDESDFGLSVIRNVMEFSTEQEPLLMTGKINNDYSYHNVISVKKTDGNEDCVTRVFEENGQGVFVPDSLLGISASTQKEETAEALVKMMLGPDVQTLMTNGLPVNMAAFEKKMEDNEDQDKVEGKSYAGMYTVDEDGVGIGFDIYWPDAQEKEEFRKIMLSLKSPYMKDSILEDAVCETGEAFLQGRRDVDEAVSAVMEKVSLYMAE